MTDSSTDPQGRSSAAIEREVNAEREQVSQTLDALGERLSLKGLVDQTVGVFSRHGSDIGRNMGHTMRSNTIPLALIGGGLTWLMFNAGSRNGPDRFADSRTAPSAHGGSDGSSLGERAGSVAADVQARAQGAASEVRARAAEAGTQVRDRADELMETHPLAAGALAFALGAALGAALPRTQQEDRAFGSESDRIYDAARQRAREEAGKAEAAAERVGGEPEATAKEVSGDGRGRASSGAEAAGKADPGARAEAPRVNHPTEDAESRRNLGRSSANDPTRTA